MPRASRRAQAPAAQLRASEALALPLNYYSLLKVSSVCSRDTLARALEAALTDPPSVGYSQQCLLARGSVLKRAVESLLDPQARKAYDEAVRIGEITEDVPDEFVPGVLALLVEAGEAQTVVAAGEEWLATHRRDPRVADVALSTVLAHRAVAQGLVKKQGDAAAAASMLQVASELLRRYRTAPDLQSEVASDLAELQPALACQLLALPLERFQEREHGVRVAAAVLTDTTGAKRGMRKQEFLTRLADTVMAGESVALYEAAGARYAELPSELYDVALAYIAEAAAGHRPELLERALGALTAAARATPAGATGQDSDSGLRQLAERRAIEERNRRQVARAVCQLLLGDTDGAAATLGLLPGSDAKCERTMLAFIKANSPNDDDLLPGLCVLGQRWVADVALGSFRGSQGTPFSLESWFESEPVRRHVTRRRLGGSAAVAASPLMSAAGQAASFLLSPVVAGMAGLLSVAGLLSDPERERLEEERRLEEAAAAGPAAPALQPHVASLASQALDDIPMQLPEVPEGRSLAEAVSAAAAADMARVDMRAARDAALRARQPAATPADLKPRHTARPDLTAAANAIHVSPAPKAMPPPVPEAAAGDDYDANIALSMQPVEQLTPLEGEERMWDPEVQPSIRWGRLAATAALLLGGGVLLARGGAVRVQPQPAGAAAARASRAAAPVAVTLTRAEAAAVVGRWQEAKAAALGPKHNVKGLSSALRGQVLKQWQERAQEIQRKGWHYLHTMEGSQINSVKVDAVAGTATVSATFREAVVAHRGASEPVQAFRSEYSVDYELAREGGSWVITAAAVRG